MIGKKHFEESEHTHNEKNSLILFLGILSGKLDEIISILKRIENKTIKSNAKIDKNKRD